MERTRSHQQSSNPSTSRPFFPRTPDVRQTAAFFSDYRSGGIQRQAESSLLPKEKEEEQTLQQKPLEATVQRMCAGCEKEQKEKSALQPKLSVGEADDPYEREADRVADQVADHVQASKSPPIQTRLESTPPRITPLVMRQGEGPAAASSRVEQGIQHSRGSGEAIAQPVRGSMEQAMGADFSGVRIHANSEADSLNRSLNARAFTTGQDIYFKGGEYQPESPAGQKLLAHELTHVVQQGGGSSVQRYTASSQQSEGLGIVSEEEMPFEQIQFSADQSKMIQRSSTWNSTGTVHETLNPAVYLVNGGDPVTWPMLNGTKLSSDAVAASAINKPTVTTSGSGTSWKAKIDSVPAQAGTFDETVLAPGPWSAVDTKAAAGRLTGLAACTSGSGNTTITVNGKPSDDAVYKANRRHENHHAADHKVAFDSTIVTWDKKVQEAKDKATESSGPTAADATTALWAAIGATPEKIAKDNFALCVSKGAAYHGTTAGGPMIIFNPAASANCSTSSVDIKNPS